MDTTNIVTESAAASLFAKMLVDILKVSPVPTPGWLLPILVVIFGEGCAFLLFLTSQDQLNRQSMSATILVGILAAGSAIGITALQNKSNET
jgi:hypothetical protein